MKTKCKNESEMKKKNLKELEKQIGKHMDRGNPIKYIKSYN